MAEITKKVGVMFAEMMRLKTMENVVIDGFDHIPAENRISKAERKF